MELVRPAVLASTLIWLVLAVAAPSGAEAWEWGVGPARTQVSRWNPMEPQLSPWATGRSLAIGVDSGMCLGEQQPFLSNVQIEEHAPSPSSPLPWAVVTTSVVTPAPATVVGPVYASEPGPGCAGVGLNLRQRIKFARPVADMLIYDGSSAPPRLVRRPDPLFHWHLIERLGPKTIEIGFAFGCTKTPRIRAHLVERPGRAIITVYRPAGRDLFSGLGPCLKFLAHGRIKATLKAPVDHLELLDGSFDRPRPR